MARNFKVGASVGLDAGGNEVENAADPTAAQSLATKAYVDGVSSVAGNLPDPSGQPDGAWLRTSSGVALWVATPTVAESDLSLSDVTTANASTSKHGLLKKLDGNAAHYMDGSGAWSTPAGGGGGAFALICDSVLGSDQASFDTNTILGGALPGGYKHLLLECALRTDAAAVDDAGLLRFNNDSTAAHYVNQRLQGNGSSTNAADFYGTQTGFYIGSCAGGTAPANSFSSAKLNLVDFAATDKYKLPQSQMMTYYGSSSVGTEIFVMGGAWLSTAAITRLTLVPGAGSNFKTGSRFTLYGLS